MRKLVFLSLLELVLHMIRKEEFKNLCELEPTKNIRPLDLYYTEIPLPEEHLREISDEYFEEMKHKFEIMTQPSPTGLVNDSYWLLTTEGVQLKTEPLLMPKYLQQHFHMFDKKRIPIFILYDQKQESIIHRFFLGQTIDIPRININIPIVFDLISSLIGLKKVKALNLVNIEFQIIAILKNNNQFIWKFLMYTKNFVSTDKVILVLSNVITINKDELCEKCQRHLSLLELGIFQKLMKQPTL